jgi:hypothetical protein
MYIVHTHIHTHIHIHIQRLVEKEGYRDKVLGAMPQLAILDGRKVEGAPEGKKKKGAKLGNKLEQKTGSKDQVRAHVQEERKVHVQEDRKDSKVCVCMCVCVCVCDASRYVYVSQPPELPCAVHIRDFVNAESTRNHRTNPYPQDVLSLLKFVLCSYLCLSYMHT